MRSIILLTLAAVIISCNNFNSSERIDQLKFEFSGSEFINGSFHYETDLSQAYVKGIEIPSSSDDFIRFQFNLLDDSDQDFYYRIYYQNKSYKHNEIEGNTYNIESSENFYGSWMGPHSGFKKVNASEQGKTVKDSFKIAGNPRNELKYYGVPVMNQMVDEEAIEGRLNLIKISPEWLKSVEEKAKKANRSLDDQIYIDALWTLDNEMDPSVEEISIQDSLLSAIRNQIENTPEWLEAIKEKAITNNVELEFQINQDIIWTYKDRNPGKKIYENIRKKRNPRMGEYEFLLVVLTEKEFQELPNSIKDIGKTDPNYEAFLNPFFYFDSLSFKNQKACYRPKESIRVSTRFTGESGIYIDPLSLKENNINKSFYSSGVGSSSELYQKAQFEQYFHVIDRKYKLKNIPIIADVAGGEYSREQYELNKKKFDLENRPITHTFISNSPGKTVFYDSSAAAIKIINPGNSNIKEAKKENVGVKTRVGLSYGKYTGKIKFTETMNKDNIWNGVTAAFWLFSEKMEPWNSRNICENEGYLPKQERKPSTNKVPNSMYSEIDIEIIKTSKHWPKTSYGGVDDYPIDNPEDNNNLIISCTNWDMTCRDPKDFNQGVKTIQYNGQEFGLHRWNYWYHALTSKFEYPHDLTVGDVIYYQIEWKPTEIIWRVGPSEDKMTIVSYMSEDNTKIPNNQMITIVTQEFHYSEWWPLSPFDQNNIPFPKKDLEGLVYEIKVE